MKLRLFTKTFEKNEFSSILGKRRSNFWILLAVFLCSIGALEFSRSGTKYLKYKMEDPFINWIEIAQQQDFENFRRDVIQPDIQERFSIGEIEANNFINEYVSGKDNKRFFSEGQTIAFDSRLLERILDKDNTVAKRETGIREDDYGWIVTQELMERLGYDDPKNYPLYIRRTESGIQEKINLWHIPVVCDSNLDIPIPIIAVVRQLPDLLDFIAPKYYLNQKDDPSHPFVLSQHPEYYSDLKFTIEDTSNVIGKMQSILDQRGIHYDNIFEIDYEGHTIRPSYKIRITIYDSVISDINDAAKDILDNIPDAYRTYDYFFDKGMESQTNYISFMFNDLSKVADFAKWTKDEYGIRIDMAQIEAKKNFETFNLLAGVLCMAIIILSVMFVSIFLWFLIDAHFKAISKNLGTIMAFGLPNKTIIKIYRKVFLRMILYSLGAAIAALGIIELLFLIIGLTREGKMEFISLADWVVWMFIIIIPVLTAIVVSATMKQKLKANPGDLIFERNN